MATMVRTNFIKMIYNAVPCEQNKKKFYLSIMPSDVLSEYSVVSRRDEDASGKGFQRLLNETRAREIAKYMREQNGVIPSALILSAQPNSNFTYNKSNSTIEFYGVKGAFLVIDGQHRLYGFKLAKKTYYVPVVIFDNLKTSEEVKLFIDINTTQKGVPAALLLDIKNLAGTETKTEERQRILFDRLNEASVLKGKFSSSRSAAGKISRSLFNASTTSIFTSGQLSNESDDIIFKAVSNFITAMSKILDKSNNSSVKLYKSIYFRASFGLFHEACEVVLNEYSNLKVSSFLDILEPISTLSFDTYTGSNNSTITKLQNDMRTAIHQSRRKAIDEDMF
ncbi:MULTISPECIES: DGQHR domain-containing protein [unclassified Desulfovibrio]|uniref:DGQHR domain-containing protein n=1 Tax=unclassified Desulfovibrio TaxID=2593640 RepID=UPI0013ED57E5|nr:MULTISPECIES: DGQHR domain-containing protein [unclassified Desulfovibrio]